jgi:hypothetical protein
MVTVPYGVKNRLISMTRVFFLYQDATYDFSKAILCFDLSLFRHGPFLLFKMLAKLNKEMTL